MDTPRGFTFIELIIVLAISGVLTALAVPGFKTYLRRSKTVEASVNLARLFDSSVACYEARRGDPSGAISAPQFPASAALTPAVSCCVSAGGTCRPDPRAFDDSAGTWAALNFSIDEAYRFQYRYTSSGSGSWATFEAAAFGDLDCDGTFSTYLRSGSIAGSDGKVTGSAGLFIRNDLE